MLCGPVFATSTAGSEPFHPWADFDLPPPRIARLAKQMQVRQSYGVRIELVVLAIIAGVARRTNATVYDDLPHMDA